MIDIRIVILFIGIIFVFLGFINFYKFSNNNNNKTIYKYIPRNVYDEIFLSLPIQFNKEYADKLNTEFILDGNKEFNKLYMKDYTKYNKYTSSETVDNKNVGEYLKNYFDSPSFRDYSDKYYKNNNTILMNVNNIKRQIDVLTEELSSTTDPTDIKTISTEIENLRKYMNNMIAQNIYKNSEITTPGQGVDNILDYLSNTN